MKQKKIIIYHFSLARVGGCETFLYNFCQMLRPYYRIKIVYNSGHNDQINRLKKLVEVEKFVKCKKYEADIIIQNSFWHPIDGNFIAPRRIGMIHTDYSKIKVDIRNNFKFVNEFVACGDNAAKTFKKLYNIECKSMRNILGELKKTNKCYHFISAGRLSSDKGYNRMLKMMEMMKKAGIFFEWTIISDSEVTCPYEEVRILKPRYDIWDYLANADYGVLLSDNEGLPYFVLECIQYGTPVIGTNVSGIKDIVENGKTGYLVPTNMEFDINIIKEIPKIPKDWKYSVTAEDWCDLLGGSYYIEPEKVEYEPFDFDDKGYRRQVKSLCQYYFKEEDFNANIGDVFYVRSEERLHYLLKQRMVKLI